ncbi:hypothetical protein KQ693_00335 [Thermus sp. PS18]|uniref:hypothetical protein n=1 Tax=Thermus sp. PS18 TaxID=2849039 RepID=UPI002265082E|nr:hypothetical protein [Thermus sp. PS18]UZX15529.1 hypothetical protein KQ693_00335 [Thermus sp. PS18]
MASLFLGGLAHLLRDPRQLPLIAFNLFLVFLTGLAMAQLPRVALAQGTPEALYGLVPAAWSLGETLGYLLSGRMGSVPGVMAALGLRLLGLALILLPFPFLVLGVLVHGVGLALGAVHLASLRQRLAPPALLGRTVAGANALLLLGGFLGTLVAGGIGQNPLTPVRAALALGVLLIPTGLWALKSVGR